MFNLPPRPGDRPGEGPGARSPVDPSSQDDILQRFQETLSMVLGMGPFGPPGRSNRGDLFGGGGPPGSTHTTRVFTSPGGGATFTFTTTSGLAPGGLRGPGRNPHDDEFNMYGYPPLNQYHHHHYHHPHRTLPGVPGVTFVTLGSHADRHPRVFGNVMGGGGIRPPQTGNPAFEGGIQNIFSLLAGLGGPHAVHGDAVYSQEALDRIITQLMEANPQSNAAPPASEAAIDKLDKKKLDKAMMGDSDKAECTICIDEMHLGDEVTVLPCKHWFHGECVVLWLKEHNTCPICRTPIEKREDGASGANGGATGGNSQPGASPGGGAGPSSSGSRFTFFSGGPGGGVNPWGGVPPAPSPGGSNGNRFESSVNSRLQSSEERQRRLNSIRNLAGPSSYGQPPPESSRNRRDSWSPTNSPAGAFSARDRSPVRPYQERSSSHRSNNGSRSGNNSGGNGGSSGSSGSGNPLSWIRDRFSGGGSSSSGNNRDNNGSSRRRS